jgi:hypothetical protein
MTTPQIEIDQLNAASHDENIEFMPIRRAVAFSAVCCIVKYQDPDLLNKVPLWIGDMVREMCETYRQFGSYRVISNLGEADHSEMMGQLMRLLEPGA